MTNIIATELIQKAKCHMKISMSDTDMAKCIIAVCESDLECGVPDTEEQTAKLKNVVSVMKVYLEQNK